MLWAVTTISLALVFYTIGVWSEKWQGSIKSWHLVLFWIGFVFDTTGTTLMSRLSSVPLTVSFHSVTGAAAILLMAAHAIWATFTLTKGSDLQKRNFHKFSILVWALWLIPYFSGMIAGMTR
ncbi:HsmA family protein [Caproicibacter sp.]|uniref:HsmA family protein n=1 Tax=Caproicibacter sp. TaxID=2814884 RepID=UPI003989F9CD